MRPGSKAFTENFVLQANVTYTKGMQLKDNQNMVEAPKTFLQWMTVQESVKATFYNLAIHIGSPSCAQDTS